ncbi:hypothetical protein EVJ58_g6164 [Rhodofomes roseus]|uniref:FHA domain-containing protein n=1 Tax=Rhodofomes roseus TaxID=34475 RepID=A0A4Y9Y9X2_9APHY|nr:hypothetical protein EVJ58_g6164 [Rhodofomes roseus]
MRLLVQHSATLPKRQILAVLDGYAEVQLGRDATPPGSETPRIRLKEMEISKLHATIFWDEERREWAVVDMGSKHGTFLRSSRDPTASTSQAGGQATLHVTAADERGTRLSAPRAASIPRRLAHLDVLSVGGTTFLVHIHEQVPCAECSPSAENEIPLFDRRTANRQAEASKKRKRDAAEPQLAESSYKTPVRDPKRALNDLRRNMLSRHVVPQSHPPQSQYTDRSALRRARHPEAVPLVVPTPAHTQSAIAARVPPPSPPVVSAPPTPLPESNIGHRLLMKQGWSPGESLGRAGSSDVALVEPLDVKGNTGKTGLGGARKDSRTSSLALDWKEAGKLQRWGVAQARHSNDPP